MTVALTGAGGKLGRVLRPRLIAAGLTLRSATFEPDEPIAPSETVIPGDLRDPAVVDQLLDGVSAIIHFAGTSVERPLPEIIENNLKALYEIYEGARRHRVKRVVFASSNHAIGMHPVTAALDTGCTYRPDGFYGLSKVWGEAMAQLYWDKHGIEAVCLRIGSCFEQPLEPRHLATWLGFDDLTQLVLRALDTPAVGFLPVWGVSANPQSYWDNSKACEILGYRPVQNAEDFATDVFSRPDPLPPEARAFQGGSFATDGMTPPDQRP